MSIFDREMDLEIQREGVWFTYDTGIELRLAFAGPGNEDWESQVEEIQLVMGIDEHSTLSSTDAEEVNIRLLTNAVLRDWRGAEFVERTGEPIPYSFENAVRIFARLPNDVSAILDLAKDAALFRRLA